MMGTFSRCERLETFNSTIPNSVSVLASTFYSCINLEEGPITVPNSVTNMQSTFYGCSELKNTPQTIPNSVINMFQTFSECKKLTGKIIINANLTGAIVYSYNGSDYKDYDQCFWKEAASIGNGLIISKESQCQELLNHLNDIKSNVSNISIEW